MGSNVHYRITKEFGLPRSEIINVMQLIQRLKPEKYIFTNISEEFIVLWPINNNFCTSKKKATKAYKKHVKSGGRYQLLKIDVHKTTILKAN